MADYIQNNYYELQFAIIFGGMFVFFILEGFIPRRNPSQNQTGRWFNNIGLAFFNHFIVLFYSIGLGFVIQKLHSDTTLVRHFQISDINIFIFLVFLMEFITYWLHRAFHKFPLLWKIHAVHHSDIEIDVTTGHRHHPLEPMINGLIATPLIIFLGAPVIVIAMVNILHAAIAHFSHSNIVLPKRLDSYLRKFIATPDFHRMHHSSQRKYTDSNFCVMFPIFDYVFGTATRLPYNELPEMEIGLEYFREPKNNRLDQLLLMPLLSEKSINSLR
ncbi:sterol desaturase family protein [Cocleimonas sp. KMM 6892]|jgi:sterol desaturase/sphingolipid hydroxylase (fatty acid hydroxylase superfamily)|nr:MULTISPECIES: sterol desaturase family protein [unclassified Cocleimonas]MEB8431319.1 sterol desaturase family protein [Cocleimonas sp. KMM 6892]MEC4713909.1 sterol desaturase family protein [Cocleimonas sp. KMM 6895]MEC4743240.1 sterol desaturase family protein [Cocleimonas sp. KMM 6896]